MKQTTQNYKGFHLPFKPIRKRPKGWQVTHARTNPPQDAKSDVEAMDVSDEWG